MPSDSTRNTLQRQWELLKLLPKRRPGKTAAALVTELQDCGYPVTKRTVERDLGYLQEAFPALECNDKNKPYGWYWGENASFDLPGLTMVDAFSLNIIENTLRPLLPKSILQAIEPRLRQAAQKLEIKKTVSGLARWTDKVRSVPQSLPLIPPKIDPMALEIIQEALLYETQLEVDYHSMSDPSPQKRTLHPVALVQRGSVTYLVAASRQDDAVKIYALHRITNATRLPDRAKVPDDFDIDHYIESGAFQFGNGKFIKLKAWISDGLARILSETPMSEDQAITHRDNGYRLSATVADSWQLRWWILAQGSSLIVDHPKSLRNDIDYELRTAHERYLK